ncbi:hypothetical protein [Sagittula stellata]|uniref:hypothetical protein n=1 Tax=Sagittula stellata TaxID=52603 RepID=UPI0012F4D144|nr:hypothetical protein [Sagittula stellata]
MFNILARTAMLATLQGARPAARSRDRHEPLPKLRWTEEDLPFRHHAGTRRGYDD